MGIRDTQLANSDERIGLVVEGRYRILRELGAGGMGTVYEAEHEALGKRVALKTLHPEYAKDASLVQRFEQEARAATAIGNEHIVDVTDLGRMPDGALFLTMELLAGRSLADLLEAEGPLPVGRAARITMMICSALEAAHAKGIVHRDMKPENVFLTTSRGDPDFVKVLDFGISKVRKDVPEASSLTRTGVAMGTPAYMSPEQAAGAKDVAGPADVWSLGVMLYEMLGGEKPFDGDSYAVLIVRVMANDPKPLRELRDDVPDELDAIVQRCLAKKVEDRMPSMAALAEALAPFASMDVPPLLRARSEAPPPARPAPSEPEPSEPPARVTSSRTRQLDASPPVATPVRAAEERGAQPSEPPALPQKKLPLVPIVLGALVLGAAGIAIALASGGEEPIPEPATAAPAQGASDPAPADPVPADPAPADPADPAPSAPAEVRIRIRAVPSDARITIGGVTFPNPMDAARPRSLDPVTIRIEREGYRAVERAAIFDSDQTLDFELARGSGTQRERPSTAASHTESAPAERAPDPQPRGDGVYQGSTGGLRDEF